MTVLMSKPAELSSATCRSCGACCSFSTEWPRFSLESEISLDRIPPIYVDDERGGMRCNGNRCAAQTRCLQSVFAWRWRLPNGKTAL